MYEAATMNLAKPYFVFAFITFHQTKIKIKEDGSLRTLNDGNDKTLLVALNTNCELIRKVSLLHSEYPQRSLHRKGLVQVI